MTNNLIYVPNFSIKNNFVDDSINNINTLISHIDVFDVSLSSSRNCVVLLDDPLITIFGIVLSIIIVGRAVIILKSGKAVKEILQVAANVATIAATGFIAYDRSVGNSSNDKDKNKKENKKDNTNETTNKDTTTKTTS